MDVKSVLWYAVLASVTGAYVIALAGVRAAKQHDVAHHSRRMIIACTVIGIWLVAYILKQIIFGREQFGGTTSQYWTIYMPVFLTHMLFAVSTIGLGSYNLYMGLSRLRFGSVGAMAAGVTTHRRLGHLLIWTFSGTIVTAYLVYMLIFVWYRV